MGGRIYISIYRLDEKKDCSDFFFLFRRKFSQTVSTFLRVERKAKGLLSHPFTTKLTPPDSIINKY